MYILWGSLLYEITKFFFLKPVYIHIYIFLTVVEKLKVIMEEIEANIADFKANQQQKYIFTLYIYTLLLIYMCPYIWMAKK